MKTEKYKVKIDIEVEIEVPIGTGLGKVMETAIENLNLEKKLIRSTSIVTPFGVAATLYD